MVCRIPLCKAIEELNKDVKNNIEPESKRYAETWIEYLKAGGNRGMINDLPCDCVHEHFVRSKKK